MAKLPNTFHFKTFVFELCNILVEHFISLQIKFNDFPYKYFAHVASVEVKLTNMIFVCTNVCLYLYLFLDVSSHWWVGVLLRFGLLFFVCCFPKILQLLAFARHFAPPRGV